MGVALITGNKGQDGFYLTELLESKGYEVIGLDKESDITDFDFLFRFVANPVDEIYNLSGVTNSEYTFEHCEETFKVNTFGCLNTLELARQTGAKIFQASSAMQSGLTPYGISKLAAHKLTRMYREVHRVFAVSGILHNHVSPISKDNVIKKICEAAKNGKQIELGNIHARRDWMHAKDAVKAMWLTLQQEKPEDYEICTGESHSVLEVAYKTGITTVTSTQENMKRADKDVLVGDPTKIKSLGWSHGSFDDLLKEMMV